MADATRAIEGCRRGGEPLKFLFVHVCYLPCRGCEARAAFGRAPARGAVDTRRGLYTFSRDDVVGVRGRPQSQCGRTRRGEV